MITLLLSALLAAFVQAADKLYTLGDLKTLQQKGLWTELISNLEDVAPRDRDAAWNTLVVSACVDGHYPEPANVGNQSLSDYCNQQLESVLKSDPDNADQAWKMGKWARGNRLAWYAVQFFDKAIVKTGDARCQDEDVALAVASGLALPPDSYAATVKQSRRLAFDVCWNALQPALKKELSDGSSYYRRNACPGLAQKQALSKEEKALCAK